MRINVTYKFAIRRSRLTLSPIEEVGAKNGFGDRSGKGGRARPRTRAVSKIEIDVQWEMKFFVGSRSRKKMHRLDFSPRPVVTEGGRGNDFLQHSLGYI